MTLLEALDLHADSRVALIGGGGKTTLLYQLGREARARRWEYRLTTSTRMAAPSEDPNLIAFPAEEGKLQGPGLDEIARWTGFVAVEADGSRGLPLKVHAEHEPVIPPGFMTVMVAGMSALGRPVHEVVHRAASLELEGAVDAQLFLRLLRRHPADAIVLNQADDPEPARALAAQLPGRVVIRGSWGLLDAHA